MGKYREALTDPMTILLFVLGLVFTFTWEPLRSLGWPWYAELSIVVGGYAAVSVAVWAVIRYFHLRKQR